MPMQIRIVNRLRLTGSLLLMLAAPTFAQTAVDVSGHWTGAIHVPPFNGAGSREVAIEIDLATNASGSVDGRFTQTGENLKGLPLAKVTVEGRSVLLELKAANGGGVFRGTIDTEGSMSGEFVTTEGGYNIPFDLTRNGEARIAPAPRSAPVAKALEGRWAGTIEVGGRSERLVLTMTNNSDGTATGTVIDLDGSNVEIPVAITQQASRLTIEVAAVNATYSASLNAANELVGTWTQGEVTLPLTLKQVSK
jgi:hypothetical protein